MGGTATRFALRTLALLLIVACRADPISPPSAPADAVPGLRAGPPLDVAISEMATDAIDTAALERLLDDAGFQGAVERTFSRSTGAVRHVALRVTRFTTADGAERYLDWLGGHVGDLIGDATPGAALAVPPDAVVFMHVPGGCCPKDVTAALVAWTSGTDAIWFIATGPRMVAKVAADLAAHVETSIER